MNTYEILYKGESTKVRTSKPVNAVATVAFKYSVSTNEIRNNGQIRIVTKTFTSEYSRIW